MSGSRQKPAAVAAEATKPPVGGLIEDPKTVALLKATGQAPSEEEALAGVLDELQEIGAIDPAAQQQLMADLKQAKPEHYELVVENFRAALDYRRQLTARERADSSRLASEPGVSATLSSHQATATDAGSAGGPNDMAARTASVRIDARRPDSKEATDALAPPPQPPETMPPPPHDVAARHDGYEASSGLTAGANDRIRPATATVSDRHTLAASRIEVADPAGDWRENLDTAVVKLKRQLGGQPANVAEVHDHMRLRALELLAGHDEDAYRPIPGTSAAQHDYWSKQLFAISAYLRDGEHGSEKERAAAALVHLDDARAALAQQATLQVRRLTFVKSVDGYGVYEPVKTMEFRAGQQVTLYAEVENFSSTSTEEGYRTTLGTSYQVLDSQGRRVEGAEFPEVNDVCRSRRRDFHMQYGVALPKRLYPGQYELELVITDMQSGKLGRARVSFETPAGP